jgi:hypothetical protein
MQLTGEKRAVDLWEKLEEHSKDVLIPAIPKLSQQIYVQFFSKSQIKIWEAF